MLENYDIARAKKFYKILDEILTIKNLSEILYSYAQYNEDTSDETNETNDSVKVTATDSEHHSQRAAEEH